MPVTEQKVTKQTNPASTPMLHVVNAAGGLAVLLGLMVMIGWFIDSSLLVQLRSQLVPMQFNTALAFVLCGAGLLSLVRNRPPLVMLFGGLSAGLALITLLQYFLGLDLGIDRLLFEPDITTKTAHPGRMSPVTALAHLLSGLALLVLARSWWPRGRLLVGRIFGMAVLALGLGNLLGYAAGGETPYGWLHPTYMAGHTAGGFMLLGAGLLAFIWRQIATQGKHSLALESGFGVAVLAVVLWQSLLAQGREHIMQIIAEQAVSLSAEITSAINSQVLAVDRMARRWEQQGGTPQGSWKADAAHYLEDNPGLQAMSWVDPSMVVRWIEPLQGNEAARDLYLAFEPRRTQALQSARLERVITATRNIELVQGGRAIIVYAPLYIDDRFDGFIGGVFLLHKLLTPIVVRLASQDYALELFEGNEEIYRRVGPGAVYEPGMGRKQTFTIVNLDWRLQLQPSQALLASLTSPLPLIALIVGLLLALLMSLTMHFGHAARRRANTMVTLNRELADEISERQRVERSLKESGLWMQGIFNALEEGVVVTTPERIMVNLNPAGQTMLGYSQQEIAGQPTAMLHVDHDHMVEFGRRIKATFDKGEVARFEFELKRKNGEIFPSEHTASQIHDEQGESIGIVSTLHDITVRKRSEEELKQYREHLEELVTERTDELRARNEQLQDEIVVRKCSEDQLKKQVLHNEIILATTRDGFWMVDLEGNICDVNEAYCEMVGYTREQLQTMTVADLEASENSEEVQLHIQKIFSQGHDRFESRHRCKDGTLIDLDISVTLANLGETQVFFTFFRDIREHIRTQQELQDSRQQLRDLADHLQAVREEEQARIARDVHDEIGQILTALNMDIHWLSQRIPGEEQEMQEKVLSMLSVIETAIGVVQRITSGLRPAMLDELGLGPVIQWYLEEFQHRTGIECESTMEIGDLPLDSGRATTVFRILQEALTNVARHAGASRISLIINSGEVYIDMRLTDNGRGITRAEIYRDDAFGLIGMRERALAFDGTILIKGHPGEGTTVLLRLPLGKTSSSG
ncbi:MAG: hypothetical protein BMS9Abin26_1529 [Gammaproteobacteria bacterium]|nr:MAG: hypothetical protein BMS9Abin26_1529 [Gammaproteobacteria bacterium]